MYSGFAAVGLPGDAGSRELREPDAEVDVRARIIGLPPALLATVAGEHDPAEGEAALETVIVREAGRRRAVEAGEDSLCVGGGHTEGEKPTAASAATINLRIRTVC